MNLERHPNHQDWTPSPQTLRQKTQVEQLVWDQQEMWRPQRERLQQNSTVGTSVGEQAGSAVWRQDVWKTRNLVAGRLDVRGWRHPCLSSYSLPVGGHTRGEKSNLLMVRLFSSWLHRAAIWSSAWTELDLASASTGAAIAATAAAEVAVAEVGGGTMPVRLSEFRATSESA